MKTQIFGTFGPACDSEEVLKKMIEAGMTGIRLNLSHITLADSADYLNAYQRAAKSCGLEPQLLIDMRGPELRVGSMEISLMLEEKMTNLLLCSLEDYVMFKDASCFIPVPKEVLAVLEIGDEILLDDGKLLLRVEGQGEINDITQGNDGLAEVTKRLQVIDSEHITNFVRVQVLRGGLLQSGKSIKVVGKHVSMPPLTQHDIENIKLAKQYGVTALMQPFVLSGEDLKYVRSVLKEYGAEQVQIFAKIENLMGVENLENIIPEADVIIIARGDLGNDMPLWELPRVQKQIENTCKKYQKPYIVVTQMLASMEEHPVPTRAEVSDIYHAVYHGAWGVMLTGETAVGKYPVEAIRYMTNTAAQATEVLDL